MFKIYAVNICMNYDECELYINLKDISFHENNLNRYQHNLV